LGKADTMHVSERRQGRPHIKRGKFKNNRPIVTLVERGGQARSFHVAVADQHQVTQIVRANVERESRLHTDESKLYAGPIGAQRESVNHSKANTFAAT
jgi:hypothetical protein